MASPRRPPVTLPLTLRNRLAALILEALHDPVARRTLEALADRRAPVPPDWIGPADREYVGAFRDRVERAAAAVAIRTIASGRRSLREALADAAALFDAALYLEVHELLEPRWIEAAVGERDVLQGLIQIAVGYQHLANGNVRGARALLDEGSAKIESRRLGALDLIPFALAVRATIARMGDGEFDWSLVPRFPRGE